MKKIFMLLAILAGALTLMCSCQPSLDDTVLELTDPDVPTGVYTCDAQEGFVLINCNRTWTAKCSDDWLRLGTKRGGSDLGQPIKFYMQANNSYFYRNTKITIKAGGATLEFEVVQMPDIRYLLKEDFSIDESMEEDNLPSGWYGDGGSALDIDGDGYGWRCWRDPETDLTYAFSMSYYESRGRALSPDNWMTSPRFVVPEAGFWLRWDAKCNDPEFTGDKYEVYIADYNDGEALELLNKVCEEVTTSADELTSHKVSLDEYAGRRICVAFHHFDSYNIDRVMITNVEVSNR